MAFDSFLHLYKNFYYQLPQGVKTFFGTFYGNIPLSMRFGNSFKIHQKAIRKYEDADSQFQLDFLYHKTYETLAFAEKHIKYYKNRFLEYDVSVKDFKNFDDLKKFPYLTKKDINSNLEDLYTNSFEKSNAYFTGGTTSTPTKYYLPLYSSRAKEKAFSNYIFSKIGYSYRDKSVLLKGREVANLRKNVFWEYEPVDNYLILSGSYLNSVYFSLIYEEVKKRRHSFFIGYPSVVLEFVKACLKNQLKPFIPVGVILTSEMVFKEELVLLKNFFQCEILTHYGLSERLVVAYRMNNDRYKFLNNYGLTRIVDNEIVGLGFDNFVMPFVNYKTNDYVNGDIEYLSNSDISISAENIEGRMQEHLVSKTGQLISLTVLASGHFSAFESILSMQYSQNEVGKVKLFIQSDSISLDVMKLKDEIEAYLNYSIDFEIIIVDFIEKTQRGKRIMCKQELDLDKFR